MVLTKLNSINYSALLNFINDSTNVLEWECFSLPFFYLTLAILHSGNTMVTTRQLIALGLDLQLLMDLTMRVFRFFI